MNKSKQNITELLLAGDFDGLVAMYPAEKNLLRALISLTYDKSGVLAWRAAECAGLLSAKFGRVEVKDAANRVLWMMREESGGNPWSAPELIGEMVRNNPGRLAEFVPILAGFHLEEIFTPGVLYAISRVAGTSYALALPYRELAFLYLNHADPKVRGNALLVLKALKDDTYVAQLEKLYPDGSEFVHYEDGILKCTTLGELARDTAEAARAAVAEEH